MGRLVVVALLGLLVVTAILVGGSYLVVFWRDTTRRWKLEKEADERKRIREANEDFVKTTKSLDEITKH